MRALRSSSAAAATVAGADQFTASARMPPLVFPCSRRAGPRPRAGTTAAPRGTPSQGAMRALRSASAAAADVAAAARPAPAASTPSSTDPCRCRAGRRPRKRRFHAHQPARLPRAQSTLRGPGAAAANVAAAARPAPATSTPSSTDPCRCRTGRRSRKRRFHARQPARLPRAQSTLRGPDTAAANVAAAAWPTPVASMLRSTDPCCRRAGRHLRTPAGGGPHGTSVQSAMRASRSSSTARATVAPAAWPAAVASMPSSTDPCCRRAGRHLRTPAGVGPRGTSVLSAMRASRSSNTACATVAPADWPAPVASTPSSIDPCRCRTGRRSRKRRFHARQPARLARAQSTSRRPGAAAANVAAAVRPVPATSTPSSTDPCCRRAGRHLRIPAAVGPRGTSVQSAMRASRSSNTARATVAPADYRTARLAHSVFDLAHAAAPPGRLRNPRTGAGFPHNHRSPRFIRFPQPTPLWKTARGRRSCDVDPSQRRFGPVDMWKTCVA